MSNFLTSGGATPPILHSRDPYALPLQKKKVSKTLSPPPPQLINNTLNNTLNYINQHRLYKEKQVQP